MRNRYALTTLVFVLAGCAGNPRPAGAQDAPADDAAAAERVQPIGHGTLKQDEFTMGLRADALLVKVTPLEESVIMLAAPDTYGRLRSLRESRMSEAQSATYGNAPQMFLVSFFSYQPDVPFQPEDLQIEHQGRLMRAATVLPLTPSWGKNRLAQQETVTAVYVFSEPINYELPIVVRYGMFENSEWQRIIPKLQVERGKVSSRDKN